MLWIQNVPISSDKRVLSLFYKQNSQRLVCKSSIEIKAGLINNTHASPAQRPCTSALAPHDQYIDLLFDLNNELYTCKCSRYGWPKIEF